MVELAGKHVVVTGASSGIGAELCRQLGSAGCRVTLAARRATQLRQVAEELAARGGRAFAKPCDVSVHDQVFELARAARDHFGEIDIWVSNAGGAIRHMVLDATEEEMLAMWRLNCFSALWAYQAVVPSWIEQGIRGQVIDVCSLGGKSGFAYYSGYCCAKHGLSGLGDSLRQELLGTGIALTTVYPGLTETGFSQAVIDHSGGELPLSAKLSGPRSWIVRKTTKRQPAAAVARRIVGAMVKPVPVLYPHRWAAMAALVANLWPAFVLGRISRLRRNS